MAERLPVPGVAEVAVAGVLGSIKGLAGRERVAKSADVRESARIHQTGEPCCAAQTQEAGETPGS